MNTTAKVFLFIVVAFLIGAYGMNGVKGVEMGVGFLGVFTLCTAPFIIDMLKDK